MPRAWLGSRAVFCFAKSPCPGSLVGLEQKEAMGLSLLQVTVSPNLRVGRGLLPGGQDPSSLLGPSFSVTDKGLFPRVPLKDPKSSFMGIEAASHPLLWPPAPCTRRMLSKL